MGDDVTINTRPCSCNQNTTTNTKGLLSQTQPASIYMNQTSQTYNTGAAISSGNTSLIGNILGGTAGIATFILNSGASLISAMNSGGIGLGDMYLMSKLSKNNSCHSNCGNSRPIIINSYSGRYAICNRFKRHMPHRFTCRPRPKVLTFSLTTSNRFKPIKYIGGLNGFC